MVSYSQRLISPEQCFVGHQTCLQILPHLPRLIQSLLLVKDMKGRSLGHCHQRIKFGKLTCDEAKGNEDLHDENCLLLVIAAAEEETREMEENE